MLTDNVVSLLADYLHSTATNMTGTMDKFFSAHYTWSRVAREHMAQHGVPWHLMAYLALAIVIAFVYHLTFTPLNRVRDWGYRREERAGEVAKEL
ncbi:hypothetical protein Pcinc_035039 [Petrolisthes cinctipes]|uniref:Uncharacterized protein n=1 Tax=Petrolisthes cinctipes TaxID=88211 RepID=A0AAE1EPK9_PETCI|nr:hypothetical protein Pcinc_035039 [Petrolisthes cinctipes]